LFNNKQKLEVPALADVLYGEVDLLGVIKVHDKFCKNCM